MRAGRLDRTIVVQSLTATKNDYGTPTEAWAEVATVRAELVQATTEEFLRGYGEASSPATVFRIRWLDGLTTDHRILYDGRSLNIREIKEIGRRKALELRCEEART